MPLITAHDKRIFFAHVPKTGGSSVEDYLVRRFGGPLSIRKYIREPENVKLGLVSPPVHFSVHDLKNVMPHDVDYFFALVRDPLQRIQSQFRFQKGASKTRRFQFSTWLRIMFAATTIDPRAYLNHIRPQKDLIPEGSEIFKLEDKFGDMIAWLDEVTGTSTPDIEVGHLLKRKSEPIPFTREDVKLITEFYRDDYDRFGYERPDLDAYDSKPYPPGSCPWSARWLTASSKSSIATGCAENAS